MPPVTSFLVRVWEPADPAAGGDSGLRGVIRHVPSGAEATFASEAELLACLRAGVTDPSVAGECRRNANADGGR